VAQRRTDLIHYPDLAVAVIKLMGPGEYMLMRRMTIDGSLGLRRGTIRTRLHEPRFPDW